MYYACYQRATSDDLDQKKTLFLFHPIFHFSNSFLHARRLQNVTDLSPAIFIGIFVAVQWQRYIVKMQVNADFRYKPVSKTSHHFYRCRPCDPTLLNLPHLHTEARKRAMLISWGPAQMILHKRRIRYSATINTRFCLASCFFSTCYVNIDHNDSDRSVWWWCAYLHKA